MAEGDKGGLFRAALLYGEDDLNDFDAMYRARREMPAGTRAVLGILGGAGAVYFGWTLYQNGFQIMPVGYLLVCSVLLVLAFSRNRRGDDTPQKYRKSYLGRHANFRFDDADLEMHLENQKGYARTKYRDVRGLFDTDRCFYIAIQGNASYILPKEAVADGRADELKKFLEKKCGKKFQHID